jgi:hypothetical protein
VVIEGQSNAAVDRLHDREAHGVGVRDRLIGQALQPASGGPMVIAVNELDGDKRIGLDPRQRRSGGADAGPEEEQPMDLGEHDDRRDEARSPHGGASKERVGFFVVPVSSAEEREPAAAIDEDAVGHGGACGTP